LGGLNIANTPVKVTGLVRNLRSNVMKTLTYISSGSIGVRKPLQNHINIHD
jgi:hypothetical protein